YNVGLVNTNIKIGENMFPSNVMTTQPIDINIDKYFLLPKPDKKEKGIFNIHRTVKPLSICEYLIKLTTFSEQAIVLDPFIGSGTTAVAAKKLGRKFIGIDINRDYIEIALKRIENTEQDREDENKKAGMQLTLFEHKIGYGGNKKEAVKK
ncbi:MAG: DNA methyltransferase, partial [Planctomycetota bacterium]